MIARILLALIRAYQVALSPLLGPVCRFEPSCSRYAAACIRSHGAGRGSLLSLLRLCKCHPFHPGGFDPPPPAPFENRAENLVGNLAASSSSPPSPSPTPLPPTSLPTSTASEHGLALELDLDRLHPRELSSRPALAESIESAAFTRGAPPSVPHR